MAGQLIKTKASVPRRANLLSRKRLLDFLQQNMHRKLTLVCSSPGYGKTSLLVDFAHYVKVPVCWYTLDSSDEDPSSFLDYVIEAVRAHFSGFGEQARALLQQGQMGDLRSLVGLLINDLSNIPERRIVLVLDEYQDIVNADAVHRVLDLFLEFLPANVHLIVASRSIPPAIRLIRLAARGEVGGLGTDDLRFTEEEVQAVLQLQFGMVLEKVQVHELTERCEGWITGILLGTQSVWQKLMGFLEKMPGPERVYDYLLAEVLDELPAGTRDFLVRVAILNRLEAGLCNNLLGMDGADKVLEWLERRNIFLAPLAGEWYRFHGLFRESLLREARANPDELLSLHRRAAQLWQERGDLVEAVEHLLQAEDYYSAASLLTGLSRDLFRRGRFQTITRWVETIPAEIQVQFPRLALFYGKALLEMGSSQRALPLLIQAQQILEDSRDPEGAADWVQAQADRSLCLRLQGSYEDAKRVALSTLPRAEAIGAPAIVDLYRVIGASFLWQGQPDHAETHYRAAVESSIATNSKFNQALAYQDLGVCLRAQGRMPEADQVYQKALAIWETFGNPGPMGSILNNLAMSPFLRGQIEEASNLLHRALEVVDQSISPYHRALVRASLADLYRDQGERAAAWQVCREGLALAQQAHNAALANYLLEAMGNLSRQEGAFGEARQYLRDAQVAAGSSRTDRIRIGISLALLTLAEGRTAEAEGEIIGILEELERGGGEQLQVLRARLVQAIIWWKLGRWKDARQSLLCTLNLGNQMGVIAPFLAERALVLPLLNVLCAIEEGGLFADLRRMLAAPPAVDTAGEESLSHLQIMALGPGEVFKDNVQVPLSRWHGKLPREAFFYMFFNAPVPKERVGEDFWPGLSGDDMSKKLHLALSRARQALAASFISFQKDAYHWSLDVSTWTDVQAFRDAVTLAGAMDSDDSGNLQFLLESALALYRGHFLQEFYSDWCVPLREHLRAKFMWVLLRLSTIHLSQHNLDRAQELYELALREDSFCERAYRGLMHVHAAAGDRALATQVYQLCCKHLQQELNVPPSPETQLLYEAISRSEPLEALPPELPLDPIGGVSATAVREFPPFHNS